MEINIYTFKKPITIWLTGLSGSGKSTIAQGLTDYLKCQKIECYILDGDKLRQGINSHLGFSEGDRAENIRIAAEIARLMNDAGLCVIVALISPLQADRENARSIIGDAFFKEIYLNTPFAICEKRDVKGLYKKARAGLIDNFTGIDSIYEAPLKPDYQIDTSEKSINLCIESIIDFLKK